MTLILPILAGWISVLTLVAGVCAAARRGDLAGQDRCIAAYGETPEPALMLAEGAPSRAAHTGVGESVPSTRAA